MLLTTTPTIEGRPVQQYLGIVTAETIFGANFFRDLFASYPHRFMKEFRGNFGQIRGANLRHRKPQCLLDFHRRTCTHQHQH